MTRPSIGRSKRFTIRALRGSWLLSPNVARWLGDIRKYFPTSVVQVMQKDALNRLDLKQMLFEPELLQTVEPDVHLVTQLLALKNILPSKTKETARAVVQKVVDELRRKLEQPTRQAVLGSLNRAARTRRPRHNEIDWHRTIRANLKHYQPTYQTIIPETRVGFRRKRSSLRYSDRRKTINSRAAQTNLREKPGPKVRKSITPAEDAAISTAVAEESGTVLLLLGSAVIRNRRLKPKLSSERESPSIRDKLPPGYPPSETCINRSSL
jgi:hypothetical protein